MNYLHRFKTHAQHITIYMGNTYKEPWVSYVDENDQVYWNKEKRKVILTSASDDKTYDGTELTNDSVIISGDGFEEGDGATFDVTGTQKLVGSSKNTFTYTLNPGTDADKYEITINEGTLTVTDGTTPEEIANDIYVDNDLIITVIENPYRDYYNVGETITFDITVTNIYSEPKDIELQSVDGFILSQSFFENVAAGAEVELTGTHIVTADEKNAGDYYDGELKATIGDLEAGRLYYAQINKIYEDR